MNEDGSNGQFPLAASHVEASTGGLGKASPFSLSWWSDSKLSSVVPRAFLFSPSSEVSLVTTRSRVTSIRTGHTFRTSHFLLNFELVKASRARVSPQTVMQEENGYMKGKMVAAALGVHSGTVAPNVLVYFSSSCFTRSEYKTVHLLFCSSTIISHKVLSKFYMGLKSVVAAALERTAEADTMFLF